MGYGHLRTPGILIEFEIGVKGGLINVNQDPMRNALRIEKEEKRAVDLFTSHVTAPMYAFPFFVFFFLFGGELASRMSFPMRRGGAFIG